MASCSPSSPTHSGSRISGGGGGHRRSGVRQSADGGESNGCPRQPVSASQAIMRHLEPFPESLAVCRESQPDNGPPRVFVYLFCFCFFFAVLTHGGDVGVMLACFPSSVSEPREDSRAE